MSNRPTNRSKVEKLENNLILKSLKSIYNNYSYDMDEVGWQFALYLKKISEREWVDTYSVQIETQALFSGGKRVHVSCSFLNQHFSATFNPPKSSQNSDDVYYNSNR